MAHIRAANPQPAIQSPAVLGLIKVFVLLVAHLPAVLSAPFFSTNGIHIREEDKPKSASDATLWISLGFAAILVLLGGAFAGLTIALMGQVKRNRIIKAVFEINAKLLTRMKSRFR